MENNFCFRLKREVQLNYQTIIHVETVPTNIIW